MPESRRSLTAVILAATALIVAVVALVVALTRDTNPTSSTRLSAPVASVRVPSVVGMRLAEARQTLAIASLRPLSTPRKGFDAPPGFVATQTPAAGALVATDSNVVLAVTTGTP
jgi:beta-lactam-binding protein with PASTA domain